jgi:hypothetical protein
LAFKAGGGYDAISSVLAGAVPVDFGAGNPGLEEDKVRATTFPSPFRAIHDY